VNRKLILFCVIAAITVLFQVIYGIHIQSYKGHRLPRVLFLQQCMRDSYLHFLCQ